ncbi:MAG: dihydroorotase [Elainellaceae cyanobacterium]
MTSDLLRQVRLLDPVSNADRIADVLISDGQIQAVEDSITDVPADAQVQDGAGLVLGPGLVDLYSHSGEPGFEDRETLESLLEAAAAGGFTRLTLLPDTRPAIDGPAGVEWLRSQLQFRAQNQPQLSCWGALTIGTKGEQMVEFMELAEAGVIGFADGKPLANGVLLRRALEYGQPLHKPIALWCCDRELNGNGVVREGIDSVRLGLPGSPEIAETAPLSALLEYIAYLNTPVHIMRVSTARGVELIRAAKAQGLPITASTTWMHLLLNITAVESYDPSLHLAPPLGTPQDQAALIQGIQDGVLEAIAVDHTPLTYEEKTVAFAESPAGAIGLELALPLLWQIFVASGSWSALDLWRYLSTNPARCLNQAPPAIVPGQPAELVLFAPQQPWQVTPHTLKSRSTNTPWLGHEIDGRVMRIWR